MAEEYERQHFCSEEFDLRAREKYSCCERNHDDSVDVPPTSATHPSVAAFCGTEVSAAAAPQSWLQLSLQSSWSCWPHFTL